MPRPISKTSWPSALSVSTVFCVAASISSPMGRPLGVSLDQAMRSLPGLRLTSSRKGRSFFGWVNGSPGCGPSVASSMAALSRTVRLTTWWTEKPTAPSVTSQIGVRSRVIFMPTRPQLAAGMRMEPRPSLAWASGTMPEAVALAAPPEEPPEMCSGFQGLPQGPSRSDWVTPGMPNSGVLVLPSSTTPLFRYRRTSSLSASSEGTWAYIEPELRGQPVTLAPRSLIRKGTPLKGPSGSGPAATLRASS